ncbi:GyrI-like domain-containing protein [Dactylosporangium sp. AC04546]|uniref:GyrI-like domain-containing protein n=1 Tax=Dactylosporangium sp. AC04546 TaxID=2862460 RepID=UPI001EDEE0CB|nr:GyrI-like domain-containing protein [Dactylosporangium sp. AC04546]WVK87827.1 GyrI-like domain-containing protein [Dactylosporangium sp. AC04546]
MAVNPTIIERESQPYVGIGGAVPMHELGKVADRMSDVFAFLTVRGAEPAGAPFFKYDVIDMDNLLEVEVGVPLAVPVPGEGPVHAGVLPAGRYLTVTHVGHPDELLGVTGELLAWADAQGLVFDKVDTPSGERWACRLELYETDPAVEPDMHRWSTTLAFKLLG